MNSAARSGLCRILFSLALVAGVWVHDGHAAAVKWEVLPDRDRVTVTLNKEEGFAGEVTRVSRTGLLLNLGVPTAGLGQELAPENAKFFRMSEPRGRALGFFMKTAAFGFVVTHPDRSTVIINAFADPLGARWTPAGVTPEPLPDDPVSAAPTDTGTTPTSSNTSENGASPTQPTEIPGVVRGRISVAPAGLGIRSEQVFAQIPSTSAAPAARREAASSSAEQTPLVQTAAPPQAAPVTPQVSRTARLDRPALGAPADSKISAKPGKTVFRSRINPGGLSDWDVLQAGHEPLPREMAESSSGTSSGISPVKPVTSSLEDGQAAAPAADSKIVEAPPTKVYVDEQGNPVPPPADPVEVLAEIQNDISRRNYKDALDKVKSLMLHPELTREQTEEVLHLNAELLFMANQDKLNENYDSIVSATTMAMNYNPDSPRNPAAYLRLGYVNLKVGNTVEADAYFTRLRRQYPRDENIPLTYYYWGEYYYDRGEMQEAADQFQYIISNYSSSQYTREASLGLARSYSALGYYQEAYDIIDYMERRWPRLYLESPSILELMGDVGYRLGKLDFALDRYMIYNILMPDGPSADVILTRIGDVFARKRLLSAAKTAYAEAERRFPDKDGGLVAMMRLAETGINDTPEVQTMMSIFQGTSNFKTVDIYKKIIQDHPQSELVPLAKLKLAMWYLANTQYEEALAQATDLVYKFPRHELVPSAEDVAMRAFSALAEEAVTRNRPGLIIANWQNNPVLQRQQDALPPGSRVALAHSMWKQGDPDGALAILAPLFRGNKDLNSGEEALLLALTINLDHDQWEAIERLGDQVVLWELTPRTKQQLDYALALAKENQGRSNEAASLWSGIAQTGKLDEKEQAYAEYFLAKDAENERRLQDAYTYGTSALNRFLSMAQTSPEQADMGKINSLLSSLIDICETSGRFAEALDYANRYIANLGPDDPQRQGLMFRVAGIYRKQGNTQEWRKTLIELAEKYPDSVHGRAAASTLRSSKLAEDAAQFSPGGLF